MTQFSKVAEKNRAFFTRYKKHIFEAGEIIVRASEVQEHVFFIAEGKITQYDIAPNGEELTVNTFSEGAFFSASWLFTDDHTSSFFYKPIEKSIVFMVPLDEAINYLHNNPDVALDLTARIARGSDGILKRLSAQMSNSARTQLVTELLLEAKRFPINADKDTVTIQITINELSAKSGLARETVSRQLNKLYDEKLIEKHMHTFRIPSIKALEESQL